MNRKYCYQSATKFSTVILTRVLRSILQEWACGGLSDCEELVGVTHRRWWRWFFLILIRTPIGWACQGFYKGNHSVNVRTMLMTQLCKNSSSSSTTLSIFMSFALTHSCIDLNSNILQFHQFKSSKTTRQQI